MGKCIWQWWYFTNSMQLLSNEFIFKFEIDWNARGCYEGEYECSTNTGMEFNRTRNSKRNYKKIQ